MRLRTVVIWVLPGAVLALGAWSEYVAYDWDQGVLWLPDLLTGAVWLGTGALIWRYSRPAGTLASAVGLTWFLGNLVPDLALLHRGFLFHLLWAAPRWFGRRAVGRAAIGAGYVAACVPALWRSEPFGIASAIALVAAVTVERRRLTAAVAVAATGLVSVSVLRLIAGNDAVLAALVLYECFMVLTAVLIGREAVRYRSQDVADLVVELGSDPRARVRAEFTRALSEREIERGADAAARLMASHHALQAEVCSRAAEVRASRRRLVVAADDERVRLEDRLRKGTLRRLATVGSLIDRFDGAPSAHLDAARAHLTEAQRRLMDLANGLNPPRLEGGLAPALRRLAESTPLPVELQVTAEDLTPASQSVAYFTCAEALTNTLKHADATVAEITVRRIGAAIEVRICDDGAGGADPSGSGLLGLADRVSAVGGTLTVKSPPGSGTVVTARIVVA